MRAWTITVDNVGEVEEPLGTNANAVGLTGPREVKLTKEQIIAHPDAKKFRMKDDDGVVYYEGYMVCDDEFAPLDDFGEPNAGCTSIELWLNNEWIML